MSIPATETPTTSSNSRSDEIALMLRSEILMGQYRAGERLPSERDLAVRFDTGRGPVREALKKLEQLGIASIQPGGARVVPIEHCNLDILGPLLELEELPDPKLVDQVLEMVGVLMSVAARDALKNATDTEIEHAKQLTQAILSDDLDQSKRHEALRDLSQFFIKVADHLILRLMTNGLTTSFMHRMEALGIRLELDGEGYREIVMELQHALDRRDREGVGDAMQRLNRFFRDGARVALTRQSTDAKRISA